MDKNIIAPKMGSIGIKVCIYKVLLDLKYLRRRNVQNSKDTVDGIDRRREVSVLNSIDGLAVHASKIGKLLLGKASIGALIMDDLCNVVLDLLDKACLGAWKVSDVHLNCSFVA